MDSLPERPEPPRPFGDAILGWLQWFGVARLVVTVVAIGVVGAGGFWLLRPAATPIEDSLPFAAATTQPAGSTTSGPAPTAAAAGPQPSSAPPTPIIVYVAGAVAAPGVFELQAGARVQQAVTAAGGLRVDADADSINLAAFVNDGDRVFVPRVGQPVPPVVSPTGGASGGSGTTGSPSPEGPVDLNEATAEQLDQLPGIGPSTAAAIIAHRDANGPFGSVDDLLDVRGIGPAKLDAIRALITT
ncbi:MAG: helix-hairpin-helix domain-containing protein [Ilumatobacteraceae bacterium]